MRDERMISSSSVFIYSILLLTAAPEGFGYLADSSSTVVQHTKDNFWDFADKPEQGEEFGKHAEGNKAVDDSNDDSKAEKDESSEEEKDDILGGGVIKEKTMNWSLPLVQLYSTTEEQQSQSSQKDAVSIIYNSFINRKTFSCPKIKNDFVTGTDTGDLTPEDIGIIAAMGDSLATGKGLWPQTDIEFRGAAFPIGGDATIDGLVTIANILHEFNNKLVGVSHGMGTRWQLPEHQLNVAEEGASSLTMPSQAKELVRRMNGLREVDVLNEWTMVIVTVGTEEICGLCGPPDYNALLESLLILNQGIRKAFVVLLGPIHVSSSYRREANLLKFRCNCLKQKSDEFMKQLSKDWATAFSRLQAYFERPQFKRQTFGLLALPMLTITSRYPHSLFLSNQPLLNRKGHTYATKWLWNRLMTGPTYNLSVAVLSHDSYYCPSMSCPYFRTPTNRQHCRLLRRIDAENEIGEIYGRPLIRRSPRKLYATAGTVVLICFLSVLLIGTMLYQKSKYEIRVTYGKGLSEEKEADENSINLDS